MCILPRGTTSNLQPADVSWNKAFKTAYHQLYDRWMDTGEHSFTPAGNMRAPDKLTCLQGSIRKSGTTDLASDNWWAGSLRNHVCACAVSNVLAANTIFLRESFSWLVCCQITCLFEIGGMIFGPTEGIIEFLRRNHLLARNMDCGRLEQ